MADGIVRISVGLNTDTAIKDAQKLGQDVQATLNKMSTGKLDSKTLSFIKNLTAAYNRMVKLSDEAQKLANTKIPTDDYAYLSKELDKAQKNLDRVLEKQAAMERTGNTTGNAYKQLGTEIENIRKIVAETSNEMQQMEKANEAFVSGTATQAYKDKAKALDIQNQAVNILLQRFEEMSEASNVNVQNTKEETQAVKEETQAINELNQAEERRRRGISRGPQLYQKRGISRGPSFQEATFLKNGADIRQTARADEQLARAEEERASATEQADEVTRRASNSTRAYGKNLGDVGRSILHSLRTSLSRLVGAFRQLSHHLHSSNKHHTDFSKNLKHSLNILLRYTLGIRSIFALIRKLRGYVAEAFKVMAQEIPEVNDAISMLGTSFKQLKASFGTMLQPLLNALAPILNTVIQKIVSLMNGIARFFATLTGQNYIYEATVANYDYAESVKEAEKANEGALASFDKLNVINKENAKNTLALDKNTVEYKKVAFNPDSTWYTRLAKSIKKAIKKADFTDVTNELAKKLAKILNSINWSSIRSKTTKFSKMLATGINGITLPNKDTGKSELADSIGNLIAEALQTAIDTFDTFITNINWKNLGKFIADAIESLKTTLRNNESWKAAGAAFGHLFQGLVEFGLELIVKGNIFSGLGNDLATMLDEALTKGLEVNPATGNTYLKDFGIMITNAITKFLDEIIAFLDDVDKSGKLYKAIQELFLGIDLIEIAKRVVQVFFKGFKVGLKALVAAGAGALGLSLDADEIGFVAEALGIGILGKKIAGLVGSITGKNGLLSAFGKKDNALDTQKKKLDLETVAAGALATMFSGTLLTSIFGVTDALNDLTNSGSSLDLSESINKSTDAFNTITGVVQGVADAISNTFGTMKLEFPKIGTSALTNLVTEVNKTLEAISKAFNGIKIPKIDLTGDKGTSDQYTHDSTGDIVNDKKYTEWFKKQQGISSPSGTVSAAALWSAINNKDDKNDKNNKKGGSSGGRSSLWKKKDSKSKTKIVAAEGAPYADLIANSVKTTEKLNAETAKYNAETYQNFLDSAPNAKLKEAMNAAFFDAMYAWGYKDAEQVFSSPNATTGLLSYLLDNSDVWQIATWADETGSIKMPASEKSVSKSMISAAYSSSMAWLANLLSGNLLAFSLPLLAQGAVLPPNKPFMAVLGDQTQGTNVEAPLSTIEKAVSNVLSKMGIKVTFDVKGDPYGMFKVMQDEARIYYESTGESAF